jgi:hypothetical protein
MTDTKKSRGVEVNKPAPKRDAIKESRSGEMTTDSGDKVEPVSPAIPHGAEHQPEPESDFSLEEQQKLVGDLEPGDKCYLPTDAEGNVQGPAVADIEAAGEWFVPVFVDGDGTHLLTSAGAPITRRMNPDTKEESGEARAGLPDDGTEATRDAKDRNTK